MRLGTHNDRKNEANLPEIIKRIKHGLVLADPLKTLGNPTKSDENLIANENYWKNIQNMFEIWPESDLEGHGWLKKQPNVKEFGLTEKHQERTINCGICQVIGRRHY